MRSFTNVNPETGTTTLPLSNLRRGQGGVVVEMLNPSVALQFMEMGILPGEYIMVDRIAPLGDPMSINVAGALLSVRREEAASVIIRLRA